MRKDQDRISEILQMEIQAFRGWLHWAAMPTCRASWVWGCFAAVTADPLLWQRHADLVQQKPLLYTH